ncbi:uncharacterized protein LOC144565614 isoform X4 [Carex rostrata]
MEILKVCRSITKMLPPQPNSIIQVIFPAVLCRINGTDINQMDARELDEFEATLLEAFRQIKHRKIALEGRKAGVNIDEATIAQGEVAPLLD